MIEHTKDGCTCEGRYCKVCDKMVCLDRFNLRQQVHTCKDCRNTLNRENRHKNIEEAKAKRRTHYQEHKDDFNAYWQATQTPEKRKAACERAKAWYASPENTPKARERTRKWRLEHPEEYKVANSNGKARRQSRIRANGGRFSVKEWNDLLVKYNYTCLCCGRTDVMLTVDHVVPISRGGSNTIDNIQPLCNTCNNSKNAKTIDYRPQNT